MEAFKGPENLTELVKEELYQYAKANIVSVTIYIRVGTVCNCNKLVPI